MYFTRCGYRPKKGDVLNEITIQIGDNVDLSDIQAIRLFYSGVEAPSRKGEHFSPVTYISSHIPGNTRKALESYSVRQDEVTAPLSRTVKLTSKQPMLKGINYFWVSIQMKPETSLLAKSSDHDCLTHRSTTNRSTSLGKERWTNAM